MCLLLLLQMSRNVDSTTEAVPPISDTNAENDQVSPSQSDEAIQVLPPSLQRFRFLAAKMASQLSADSSLSSADESLYHQLNQYIAEIQHSSFIKVSVSNPIVFWQQREAHYDKLAPVALDIIASPASQAFVERIFSICGILTCGRRNRMDKSLTMRACLKLNKNVLLSSGFIM
jgi:hypothetical protein